MDLVKTEEFISKLSFSRKESLCEDAFRRGGPFWHFATDGTRMDVIFTCREDYILAMNVIAWCCLKYKVRIITFEVMSDHLHFLLEGSLDECKAFLEKVKARLRLLLSRTGRIVNWSNFTCDAPIPVTDLRMLRNEIVYINRNGFLVDTSKTPFSYEWGSGYLYFNAIRSFQIGRPVREMTYREKRLLLHTDNMDIPSGLRSYGGIILPGSYCDIDYGQSFFRDGNHYFNLLSKAFEAYSESSKRLGDKVFINDEEVYPAVADICRRQYGVSSPRFLDVPARLEVAKIMHGRYNSSNEQIRRIIGLDIAVINELFPVGK